MFGRFTLNAVIKLNLGLSIAAKQASDEPVRARNIAAKQPVETHRPFPPEVCKAARDKMMGHLRYLTAMKGFWSIMKLEPQVSTLEDATLQFCEGVDPSKPEHSQRLATNVVQAAEHLVTAAGVGLIPHIEEPVKALLYCIIAVFKAEGIPLRPEWRCALTHSDTSK